MKKNKYNIIDMRGIAEQRGGQCLSSSYINSTTKLKWKCREGHIWRATPGNIRNGRWCNKCARKIIADNQRLTITEMNRIAKMRGGKCLSSEYKNKDTKLKWQCKNGHKWEATPGHVKLGTWCPVCKIEIIRQKKRKYTIPYLIRYAQQRGGKCLSKNYSVPHAHLKWQCSEGHTWNASIGSVILKKSWCPYCSGNARLTIEEMQMVAKERGGDCLSDNYVNSATPLKWQCASGHKWNATPSKIRAGGWCPICSVGLGERICRVFFESLFEKKFPKRRPKWLVNDDGNQMELDGYCRSLNIAFEHQGEQHYEDNHIFHSKQTYKRRKRDDKRKEALCIAHKVALIKVPEIPRFLKLDDVKEYIIEECKKKRIGGSLKVYEKREVNVGKAYLPESTSYLNILRKIAGARGGRCISDYYLGNFIHLEFHCKQGHTWRATPANIKRGKWCPYCVGKYQTIEDMQRFAVARGGRCISDKYVNDRVKLGWQCSMGHTWKTSPSTIKAGSWCPVCAGRKKYTKI